MSYITRREAIAGAALFLAQACTPRPTEADRTSFSPRPAPISADKKPSPPVPMAEERIIGYETALSKTNNDFLKFSASLLGRIRHESKPVDFPYWLTESSFPLQVEVSEDNFTSDTWFGSAALTKDPDYTTVITTAADTVKPSSIESLSTKLILGSTDFTKKDGPLYESFFLAKELLTLMVTARFAKDINLIIPADSYQVYEPDGTLSKDPRKLTAGSQDIFLHQLFDKNSQIWKLIDSIPLYLVGSQIPDLIKRGVIPNDSKTVRALFVAANICGANASFGKAVTDLANSWRTQNSFLPPEGSLVRLTQPDFNQIIQTNKLY